MAENKNTNVDAEIEAIEASASEAAQEAAEVEADLLADLPEMTDPLKLRIAQKNMLKRIMLTFGPVFSALRETADEDGKTDASRLTRDQYEAMFEALEAIDAFGEAMALDKDAYAEWSQGKGDAAMYALYGRYTQAQGE